MYKREDYELRMEQSIETPIEAEGQDPSTLENPELQVDTDPNAKEKDSSSEDRDKTGVEDTDPVGVATTDEHGLIQQPLEEKTIPEVEKGKEEEEKQLENPVEKSEMGHTDSRVGPVGSTSDSRDNSPAAGEKQSPSNRQMLLERAGVLLDHEKHNESASKPLERDNLESYSESLMEDGSSGEEGREAGSGKRVRFADQVVRIPEGAKKVPQNAQRRKDSQEHSTENLHNGASNEVSHHL